MHDPESLELKKTQGFAIESRTLISNGLPKGSVSRTSQNSFDPLAQTIEVVWKPSSPADPGGEAKPYALVKTKNPIANNPLIRAVLLFNAVIMFALPNIPDALAESNTL